MTSRTGNKAFLLVEAVVTGVVMATGVAMVSRSLTTPLHALRRLQERDTLLRLADSALAALESRAMFDPPLAVRHGVLEPPHERYEWTLRIAGESDGAARGLPEDCRAVALMLREIAPPASGVTLTSLWPREWVE
ncbi:MAG: hypothetical protein HYY91_05060 [Candidatus Omnitrophica bacterium]|nr:hypothetical protein [Candidatus Omnitrophota bacterium]